MLTWPDCTCSLYPRLHHLEDLLCGLLCWGQAQRLGFLLLKFYLLVTFFTSNGLCVRWVQPNGTEAHRVKSRIPFSTFPKVDVVLTCASADIPSCPCTHCSMFLFSMLNRIVPSVSCSSRLQARYLCQLILCHRDWAVRAQAFGLAWIWACLWGVSGWGEHWVSGLCKADGPLQGGLHLPTGRGRGLLPGCWTGPSVIFCPWTQTGTSAPGLSSLLSRYIPLCSWYLCPSREA